MEGTEFVEMRAVEQSSTADPEQKCLSLTLIGFRVTLFDIGTKKTYGHSRVGWNSAEVSVIALH